MYNSHHALSLSVAETKADRLRDWGKVVNYTEWEGMSSVMEYSGCPMVAEQQQQEGVGWARVGGRLFDHHTHLARTHPHCLPLPHHPRQQSIIVFDQVHHQNIHWRQIWTKDKYPTAFLVKCEKILPSLHDCITYLLPLLKSG